MSWADDEGMDIYDEDVEETDIELIGEMLSRAMWEEVEQDPVYSRALERVREAYQSGELERVPPSLYRYLLD